MRIAAAALLIILTIGTLVAACARPGPQDGAVELAVPDRANAHVTLAADGGRVVAAWAATGTGTDIYAAVSNDEGRTFSRPVRVNHLDGDANSNGEQPPRVALKGDTLNVIWVSKREGIAGIQSATSTDGGATFAATRTITPAAVTGARGWESVTFADDGTVHAAWLDGRSSAHTPAPATTKQPEAGAPSAHHHHEGLPMRQNVYHAMWKGDEAPVETEVAEDVCFCCKTAIVSRGSRVYVAWRHLFPGGVRDIAIARSSDGGRTFSAPVRVSEDNWKIDACPDDGPAMTVDPDGAVRVVWPTLVADARGGRMGIFEAVSRDGGATFSPRERVDAGDAAPAHPRIAAAAPDGAAVCDELAGGSRRAMLRVGRGPAVAVSTGRAASYPAVAATTDGVVVAYTDQLDDRSVIRALRVPAVRP